MYRTTLKTRHVFIEGNQVFLKGDPQESTSQTNQEEIWYPVDFQWIQVAQQEQNLIVHSKLYSK